MKLWRIIGRSPPFVAGLLVDSTGHVAECAPILWWTRGKRWEEVRQRLIASGCNGERL